MISCRNVTVVYGSSAKTVALNGINLEFPDDTVTAIMGKSGSGKTTLLKVIGGLLSPTDGKAFVDDEDIYSLSDNERCRFRRRRVGFIFQSYDLLAELTAYENIALPLMLNGRKPKKGEIEALGGTLGIGELMKRFPDEMSGGEQQRIAIARAIIHRPQYILCDEPTGNLDETTSETIMDTIIRLQALLRATVIIVTHDKDVAARAGAVVHLKDGMLEV